MLKKVEINKVVEESGLASTMKSGSLPVLATPQMVAWMEEAACQCLDLEEGMTSVGILMNVEHVKASPLGASIRVVAEITKEEGRKIEYDVAAYQDEKLIGKGHHERFIVQSEKFVKKTYEK